MLRRIRPEFKCLQGQDQNFNISKVEVKIPMFGKERSEFVCLERQGENSNNWKD